MNCTFSIFDFTFFLCFFFFFFFFCGVGTYIKQTSRQKFGSYIFGLQFSIVLGLHAARLHPISTEWGKRYYCIIWFRSGIGFGIGIGVGIYIGFGGDCSWTCTAKSQSKSLPGTNFEQTMPNTTISQSTPPHPTQLVLATFPPESLHAWSCDNDNFTNSGRPKVRQHNEKGRNKFTE